MDQGRDTQPSNPNAMASQGPPDDRWNRSHPPLTTSGTGLPVLHNVVLPDPSMPHLTQGGPPPVSGSGPHGRHPTIPVDPAIYGVASRPVYLQNAAHFIPSGGQDARAPSTMPPTASVPNQQAPTSSMLPPAGVPNLQAPTSYRPTYATPGHGLTGMGPANAYGDSLYGQVTVTPSAYLQTTPSGQMPMGPANQYGQPYFYGLPPAHGQTVAGSANPSGQPYFHHQQVAHGQIAYSQNIGRTNTGGAPSANSSLPPAAFQAAGYPRPNAGGTAAGPTSDPANLQPYSG